MTDESRTASSGTAGLHVDSGHAHPSTKGARGGFGCPARSRRSSRRWSGSIARTPSSRDRRSAATCTTRACPRTGAGWSSTCRARRPTATSGSSISPAARRAGRRTTRSTNRARPGPHRRHGGVRAAAGRPDQNRKVVYDVPPDGASWPVWRRAIAVKGARSVPATPGDCAASRRSSREPPSAEWPGRHSPRRRLPRRP